MTQEIPNLFHNKDNSIFFNCNNSINFSEINLSISKNNLFSKDSMSLFNSSDDEVISNNIFTLKDFGLKKDDFYFNNNEENSEKNCDLNNFNNINKNSFEKNRNYFNNNNNLSEINNKEEPINEDLNNNNKKKYIRCDSLLIKFKSTLGKWYIKIINQKLKHLKEKNIMKRSLKIFSFNYKKFTLNVSYTKNKRWLDCKMKDLLVLGDEENQNKNRKNLKSLFKKKFEELNEIKDMLELSYRDIIEKFYCLSNEFSEFKSDKKVKELDNNFKKIMDISILEKNGFIEFLETRKGNNKKK